MEFLKSKQFDTSEKLVLWVNKKRVKVLSITCNQFCYTLFYKKDR